MRKLVICIVALLSISACRNDIVYSEKYKIENQQWNYNHPLIYNFEVSDTLQKYDLILNITHNREYVSQNTYCKFITKYPNGRVVQDVVSLELSDEMGQWIGKCTSTNCNVGVLLQSNILFKESGKHQITIEQYSRNEILEGIEAMELQLQKSQVNK